jgi:hypothetical protein
LNLHDKSVCGARRVHYILLGMADALCEAKCVDQGISAKCISCFGHNGVSQEEGEVDVLFVFIYMYVLICIEMSMLVHMYLYISGCRGILYRDVDY